MMEVNQKIRFAVIGSGHIGKRHAEMIRRNNEAELVGMSDIKKRSDLNLTEFSEVPFFSSADEMIAETNADVICVCSPNGLHAEHTLKVLEQKKHVVIEKPMALRVAECEKIIFKALQV